MDRRTFIRAAGVAAAASPLAAPAVLAQDKQIVRMVTTWPRNFPGLGTGAQRVADRITAMTNGRVEVRLFAAGELVPAFESFDAVATGAAEMYHGVDYYWQGKHKAYNFFATVPMGFTAAEINAWIHYGGGQDLWDELGRNFGVKGLMAGNTGVQYGGWFRNPIMSVDDLRGLKMRIPGLGGEVIRAVGGTAVALPGGEIFPALQAGTIDATEWVGPYNDIAFGFQNILKNYMYPGFHEPGPILSVGVNLNWWERLDAADRAAVECACLAENEVTLAEMNANNGPALDRLINEHGVQLIEFPKEVFAELAKASEEVVASVGSDDPFSQRVYESYASFRKSIAASTRLSEEAYTRIRYETLGI